VDDDCSQVYNQIVLPRNLKYLELNCNCVFPRIPSKLTHLIIGNSFSIEYNDKIELPDNITYLSWSARYNHLVDKLTLSKNIKYLIWKCSYDPPKLPYCLTHVEIGNTVFKKDSSVSNNIQNICSFDNNSL
jgi:hypothetical protein